MCATEPEQVQALECAHSFHAECIQRHLVRDKRCPVCRQTGVTINVADVDSPAPPETTPTLAYSEGGGTASASSAPVAPAASAATGDATAAGGAPLGSDAPAADGANPAAGTAAGDAGEAAAGGARDMRATAMSLRCFS